MDKQLAALAEELEAALIIDEDLSARVIATVKRHTAMDLSLADLDSTDAILDLVFQIRPGWSVSIRGTASQPNGHWQCSLRRSSSRDNDEYVGFGRGPTLPHAFLASLLKAISFSAG